MPTITYKTEEASFCFDQQEVLEVLQSSEGDPVQSKTPVDLTESHPGDAIVVLQNNRSLAYAMLRLLEQGKGSVHCKGCESEYQAKDLIPYPLGAGGNPLRPSVKLINGFFKRLFGRSKRMPLFGGKGYACPRGHSVIEMITWRT